MSIEIIYWIVLIGVFAGLAYLGRKTNLKLWVRVVAALVIGAILGFIFGRRFTYLHIGELCYRIYCVIESLFPYDTD